MVKVKSFFHDIGTEEGSIRARERDRGKNYQQEMERVMSKIDVRDEELIDFLKDKKIISMNTIPYYTFFGSSQIVGYALTTIVYEE